MLGAKSSVSVQCQKQSSLTVSTIQKFSYSLNEFEVCCSELEKASVAHRTLLDASN